MEIHIGHLVRRKSYQLDILFRVMEFKDGGRLAILYGEGVRLEADAPIEDLVIMNNAEYRTHLQRQKEIEERGLRLFQQDYEDMRQVTEYHATGGYTASVNYFQMPGRILHLDGDPLYLKKCLDLYEKLGVPVQGIYCKEIEMPQRIGPLLDQYRPDVLVLTGHDAYIKQKGNLHDIKAYRHSQQFIDAVSIARSKFPSLDQLVIFAGACQSNFEAIIRAGANFASAPARINIHALDPVYIVSKICFTPFQEKVNLWDTIRNTYTGEKGLGGIDTKGLLRVGLPFALYEEDEEDEI